MENNQVSTYNIFCFEYDDIHFKVRALITLVVFISFCSFVLFIYKLLRDAKTKQRELKKDIIKDLLTTSAILLGLWVIEGVWVVWIEHAVINIVHIIYEAFLIIITFILLITSHIKKDYWNENVNYSHLELTLNNKLKTLTARFYALSLDDFNNFFEPLGLWYICEQARNLKEKNKASVEISAKRILVIDGDIVNNELLKKAFGPISNLTFSQKNMKNIDLLHSLFHIDLYLLPKSKLIELITSNNLLTEDSDLSNKKIIEKKLNQFERLIIDNEMVYPRKEKDGFKLTEDSNCQNKKSFIISLFENSITNFDINQYRINVIKTLYK